jgi:hypothetical protein
VTIWHQRRVTDFPLNFLFYFLLHSTCPCHLASTTRLPRRPLHNQLPLLVFKLLQHPLALQCSHVLLACPLLSISQAHDPFISFAPLLLLLELSLPLELLRAHLPSPRAWSVTSFRPFSASSSSTSSNQLSLCLRCQHPVYDTYLELHLNLRLRLRL